MEGSSSSSSSSSSSTKHAHRLFAPWPYSAGSVAPDSDEFDESDVWASLPVEPRKPTGSTRACRKTASAAAAAAAAAAAELVTAPASASAPVRIPDWSKILQGECGGRSAKWEVAEDAEWGESTAAEIPPHELLDRSRAAPFSVHQGFGRTLKGRDLSRVRNAIWEKTGF